jgi:RHS repeat-associated protein
MQLRKTFVAALPVIIALTAISFSLKGPFAKGEPNYTETTYYFLTDHLGSVDTVLDDQGNVVERADYLPFGSDRLRITETSAPETDYKFTGKEMDDETGLMYYGARYYDATIGRFISFDPLLLNEGSKPLASVLPNPQALNPYSYVTNNPITMVDETGEYGSDVHYDLTFFLSMAAGLNYGQSKTIATFDQYTDENPATLPLNFKSIEGIEQSIKNTIDGTTGKYHFASFGTALVNTVKALAPKKLSNFGESLHTFQDTYSHAGLNPVTHLFELNSPDLTYNNPEKASAMAESSFKILRGFNMILNGTGGIGADEYEEKTQSIWNFIDPHVSSFILSEDKTNTVIGGSGALSSQNAELSSNGKTKKKEEAISSK